MQILNIQTEKLIISLWNETYEISDTSEYFITSEEGVEQNLIFFS